MKNWVRCCRSLYLLVAVLLCCWSVSLGAQLVNPSFEQSDDEDNEMSDVAAHWGRWGEWINRETGWTPVRDGDCLLAYHHWRIVNQENSGVYQDVAEVPAGASCEFSVYAMCDDHTNIRSVELRMETLKGGDVLASKSYSPGKISKNKWKKLSVSGVPATDGVRVLIIVTPAEDGERVGAVKFDEASLVF